MKPPSTYRVVSGVKPEDLADLLTALAADGFTDWQVMEQEEVRTERASSKTQTVVTTVEQTKYRVLAWTEPEEVEEDDDRT